MIRSWFAFAPIALLLAPSAQADATGEAAASATLARATGNAAQLRVLLQAMPKGGDLHNHLGGTPYAEDYLKVAAEKGMCADENGLTLSPPPCPAERGVQAIAEHRPFAFARLVDSLSTRGVQQGVGAGTTSGHDQFFSSFGRFAPAFAADVPRWIALARRNAARDHASYLELQHDPSPLIEYILAAGEEPVTAGSIPSYYAAQASALPAISTRAIAEIDEHEARVRTALRCGTKAADPGCDVTVRYLTFAWRGMAPAKAYRSLIASFALAAADPRFVGVNIVMPEDDPVALRDYDLHMAMFRFLKERYPGVRVTMHAGELTLGLVPPDDLRDHIAKAVVSGAERIGHGTDIAFEDNAEATLTRMARDGIAVEVNLTSNAVILGVRGGQHPLQLYRSRGVPVVLSTDDAGVLRSDLTNEYQRAVTDQGLGYPDLKVLARASLEYAFVPGASLWREHRLGSPVAPCAGSLRAPQCASMLGRSEKARLQADLEARLDRFESDLAANGQRGAND